MLSSRPTKALWDFGTGYDLFISLLHLFHPEDFNVRASWAASILDRLSDEDRRSLAIGDEMMLMPIYFVHKLAQPKDSLTCINTIAGTPASRRLEALSFGGSTSTAYKEVILSVRPGHKWSAADKAVITEYFNDRGRETPLTYMELLHHTWAHREEFGAKYLQALRSYHENFFAEEEQRILPVLRQGLSHAQMRAGSLPLAAMLEELSAGVRYGDLQNYRSVYFAPSFWSTPYLHHQIISPDTLLLVFGARPENMPLIPGDIVPDSLLRGLKALSDPTRLRILRDIAQTPQTASQLSRSLRLRPPTVAHHLRELRLASVVQIIVDPKGERRYGTRFEGFETIQDLLIRFVHGE